MHCQTEIELLSAKDLDEQFSISANALQHARERGTFPAPWIFFGNRNIWLLSDITAYAETQARGKVEKTVSSLLRDLERLPDAERAQALKMIRDSEKG